MYIEIVRDYIRYRVIHQAWTILIYFLVLSVIGCTVSTPNAGAIPSTKTYLGYAAEATKRGDWVAAYRLLEDALVSENPALCLEAENLIDKFPQIRNAAFESFSLESLENTYQTHGEQAWQIEEERLSIYQSTLATPEEAEQAWLNYKEVYGNRITLSQIAKKNRLEAMEEKRRTDNEFENEIQRALLSGEFVRAGVLQDLLKGMVVGQTLRNQALARFGRPSSTFESHTILTWAVRVEGNNYSILADFIRNYGGVTHSLVMTFDKSLVLNEMAVVRVVK